MTVINLFAIVFFGLVVRARFFRRRMPAQQETSKKKINNNQLEADK